MKNKYFIKPIKRVLFISLLGLFTSCTDGFEELNKNPNSPTEIEPKNVVGDIMRNLSNRSIETSFDLTNKLVQYTVRYGADEDFYRIDSREDFWGGTYDNLRNLNYVMDNYKEGYEYYTAVCLITKSWMFSILTNFYGDIPYSESGVKGIDFPKFDAQKDVYQNLISDLEKANTILKDTKSAISLEGDFVYGGDILKWRKFANSLLVRLLITQSKQVDPSAKLKAILADKATYPLFESNADQAEWTYLSDNINIYPRRDGGGWVEATYASSMLVDNLLNLKDERIKALCDTISGVVPGTDYVGLPSGNQISFQDTLVSGMPHTIRQSRDNPILKSTWMSYAELQFLLAEAAQRSWIDGGTAQAKIYYEQGIKASYDYLQAQTLAAVDAKLPMMKMSDWDGSYLANSGVAYTGTDEEKLEKIGLQKWIALYNHIEAYFSWRRTGYPKFTIGKDVLNGGEIPLRLNYTNNSKTYNEINYKKALQSQGEDKLNTKIWLLK